MFSIIAIVFIIILWIKVSGLSRQIEEIKRGNIGKVTVESNNTVSVASKPLSFASVEENAKVSDTPAVAYVPSGPSIVDRFISWFSENWVLKIGVIFIIIGFGWFISYAFIHQWIGPRARVTLGFTVGSIFALFGTWRMVKHEIQGTTFLILGSAIAVITSFASQVTYGFFSPAVALFIPALVAFYVAFVAYMYNKQSIAIYGVIIGFMAPLMIGQGSISDSFLFVYIAVVSCASIWISVAKDWRSINALSVVGFLLYTLAHVVDSSRAVDIPMVIIYGLSAIYFIVSMVSVVKSNIDVKLSDGLVAVVIGLIILLVTVAKVTEELQSLVLGFWLIPIALGSFYVFMQTKKEKFFYLYGCVALAFLGIATAIELDGSALVFAFAFEAVAVSLISYLVTNKLKVGYTTSLLMTIPAIMALGSFGSSKWIDSVFHEDFFVIFIISVLFFVLSIFYYLVSKDKTEEQGNLSSMPIFYTIFGSAYAFGLLWMSLHALIEDNSLAILYALIVYTLIGLATYIGGILNHNKAIRYYGAGVLMLVVLRLVFVDVWMMDLSIKIITFVLIGALFISMAFLKKNND